MPGRPHTIALAALSLVWGCLSAAHAETLRCTSVNGSLNCVGSHGMSCQTVNGRKVCISGHGDVVQSFGNGHADSDGMDSPPSSRIWRKMVPRQPADPDADPTPAAPDWPTDSDD